MSSETKQIRSALFQLSFPFMGKIVCGLPLFATFFCVLWSVLFDFEKATATHCRVNNYLPSISAAIGGFTPQRYVWRICIAFHAAPRLMIAWAYYNFHTSVHAGKHNELYKAGAALTSLCHVIEVTALVGLTYISSLDNHGLHETLFIVFMASSLVYMLLTILLFYWGRSRNGSFLTLEESRSFSWKQRLFLTNISIFLFSVYVFFRHNWYCEPGVYTIFAACEYTVVVTNICFHYTAVLDFRCQKFLLTGSGDMGYLPYT
ncbi:post-GPI attachment to proteins factor 2-like isoform X2 [Biomphalaria glabrata]|uniref:Post-GPI attachment to proteins factor 2-like isoform X2 n=1 Tax=Biomphalaria glabrata TaxID=6526 RepID=A0A9W3B4E2_BIOGL|nr:post-GPI attachment to proteins factor 2-like isoform X2 [Biomphalaria glabrata]